jgi:hypothetical protein
MVARSEGLASERLVKNKPELIIGIRIVAMSNGVIILLLFSLI